MTIFVKREIEESCSNVKKQLTIELNSIKNSAFDGSLKTPEQFFLSKLSNCHLESTIKEIIVSHSSDSEKIGPGGFLLCLKRIRDGLCTSVSDVRLKSESDIQAIKEFVRHVTMNDVKTYIDTFSRDEIVKRLIQISIDMSGFKGRISLETSESNYWSVESIRGYTFKIKPLFDAVGTFHEPRVSLIDGMIESVSEAYHLFSLSSETKEPMMLFTRGMHPDVLNTLRVNYDRNTLRIVPFKVEFDVEGLNTLNDISVIAGGGLTSSLKGELISTIKYESLPRVDKSSVTRDSVTLVSSKTRKSVSEHMNELLRRRTEKGNEFVENLYDKRLRTLTSDYVSVRIPKAIDESTVKFSLDRVLRSVKSSMEHGVVEIDGVTLPTMTYLSSIALSLKCLETIDRLGAVIF